jgi:hypothetical protein
MNYLLNGGYNQQKLELLLEVVNIRSEDIIAAVNDYLIRGASIDVAAAMNLIDAGNLNRAIKKLNAAAERFDKWNQLCFKNDNSKEVTLVIEKRPARMKKPESWKLFFGTYPANKKGGTDTSAWKAALREGLTEDDFVLMLDDVVDRARLMPSWATTYAQGITRYIADRIWLTPITPEVKNAAQSNVLDNTDWINEITGGASEQDSGQFDGQLPCLEKLS